MDKQRSMQISAQIGNIIASRAPKIKYSPSDLKKAEKSIGKDGLEEMREIGLLGDDFELFYVIREFCSEIGLGDVADGDYIIDLFKNAKKLDAFEFEADPYIAAANIPTVVSGDITLTCAEYARGEIFQYDMPDLAAKIVTPRLGFFDRGVSFPSIYQGEIPWMSVCPSEIYSMREPIAAAHGRVLVLGLGLGYYPFMISRKAEVESIVIVELQQSIADIFNAHILPHFEHGDKLKVITADAIAYMEGVKDGDFDFCFADIWEGAVDGAEAYKKLRPYEKKLPHTEFAYWIEEQIKAYLEE